REVLKGIVRMRMLILEGTCLARLDACESIRVAISALETCDEDWAGLLLYLEERASAAESNEELLDGLLPRLPEERTRSDLTEARSSQFPRARTLVCLGLLESGRIDETDHVF